MKKIAFLLLIVTMVMCGLIWLFLEGSFLPYKPCRPLTYPDAKRTTHDLDVSTIDALEVVLSFYDACLGAKEVSEIDFGEWGREDLGENKYLYQCYSTDINGLTTESGCIYISHDGIQSSIETKFYRSEGGSVPCPR